MVARRERDACAADVATPAAVDAAPPRTSHIVIIATSLRESAWCCVNHIATRRECIMPRSAQTSSSCGFYVLFEVSKRTPKEKKINNRYNIAEAKVSMEFGDMRHGKAAAGRPEN